MIGPGLWDHPRFKDVYMYVHKIRYRGPAYLKASVTWFNRRTKNILGNESQLKIPRKTWKEWIRITDA